MPRYPPSPAQPAIITGSPRSFFFLAPLCSRTLALSSLSPAGVAAALSELERFRFVKEKEKPRSKGKISDVVFAAEAPDPIIDNAGAFKSEPQSFTPSIDILELEFNPRRRDHSPDAQCSPAPLLSPELLTLRLRFEIVVEILPQLFSQTLLAHASVNSNVPRYINIRTGM